MKIVLDECVDIKLKRYLVGHDVSTVRELQWRGLKNGKLLTACVNGEFDVLLTVDKQMRFQQNMEKYNVALIVIDAYSIELPSLTTFISKIEEAIMYLEKGKVYVLRH